LWTCGKGERDAQGIPTSLEFQGAPQGLTTKNNWGGERNRGATKGKGDTSLQGGQRKTTMISSHRGLGGRLFCRPTRGEKSTTRLGGYRKNERGGAPREDYSQLLCGHEKGHLISQMLSEGCGVKQEGFQRGEM